MLFGRSPPDAGLVLIQEEEPDQAFLLPLQFGHLGAGLHGAHTSLHYSGNDGKKGHFRKPSESKAWKINVMHRH